MTEEVFIDIQLLISLVEVNPALWDKSLETYKTPNTTKDAWDKILNILIPDFQNLEEREKLSLEKTVLKKWTHVRDSYLRSIRKIQEQKMAKLPRIAKPYLYSKQLKFLHKVMYPKPSSSSEPEDLQDSQDGSTEGESSANTTELKKAPTSKSKNAKAQRNVRKKPIGKDISPIAAKMMKFMETVSQGSKPTNRHMSFFMGILPTLDNFDDDEVLEFQGEVLKLLKTIKNNRNNYSFSNSPSTSRPYLESDTNVNPLKIDND